MLLVAFGLLLFGAPTLSQAQDKALSKQGECPFVESVPQCPSVKPNECAIDVDCNNTEKCCYDGCVLKCIPAVFAQRPNPNMCEASVDLGFLIDSSASIGYKNFKGVRKMVDRIINVFTISPKKTHVAIITISDSPEHALKFNTLQGDALNSENVRRVVDNLKFTKGKTRIDLALKMAHKEMFNKYGGGRDYAQKILVVFTDGIQTWKPPKMVKLNKAAEPLKKIGVKIIPVGVWSEEINVGSLLDMSMDEYTVFNMEFFPEMLQALKKMSKVPCDKLVVSSGEGRTGCDSKDVRSRYQKKLTKVLKRIFQKKKP